MPGSEVPEGQLARYALVRVMSVHAVVHPFEEQAPIALEYLQR